MATNNRMAMTKGLSISVLLCHTLEQRSYRERRTAKPPRRIKSSVGCGVEPRLVSGAISHLDGKPFSPPAILDELLCTDWAWV
jgi:hypothetical protein